MPRRAALTLAVLAALFSTLLPLQVSTAAPPSSRTLTGTYQRLSKSMNKTAHAIHNHGAHGHEYTDLLEVGDTTYRLHLPKGLGGRIKGGTPVRVKATVSGLNLAVEQMEATAAAAAAPPNTGSISTLVILAYWTAPDSVTTTSATNQIFSVDNAWFREVSYGALGVSGKATPWVRITGPNSGLCYQYHDQIMAQARAAARAKGYDYAAYRRTVVYFPTCSGGDTAGTAGWAYQPGDKVWINGQMNRTVTAHEMGHNHNLWHANSLNCSSGGYVVTMGGSCDKQEYGDLYDTMGAGDGHFSGAAKDQLGWLTNRKKVVGSAATSFTLAPLEKNTTTPVVAVISTPISSRKYYVEYRQPIGFDKYLTASATTGVMVRLRDSAVSPNPLQLDLSPSEQEDWEGDILLKSGRRWTSPEGVRISVGTLSTTGASISVAPGQAKGTVPSAPTTVKAQAMDGRVKVTWAAPASDGGSSITSYVVRRADGAEVKTVASSARSVEFGGLTNGQSYGFTIRARNPSGVSAYVATAGTPVVMPPSITFTAPASNASVAGTVLMKTAPVVNPTTKSAIESVEFYIDGQSYGYRGGAPYELTWDASDESEGAHTLKAVVTDTNRRTATTQISVNVLSSKPTVVLTAPTGGATINADSTVLTAQATPKGAGTTISYVEFYAGTSYIGYDNTAENGVYQATWDTRDEEGSYTLTAKAGDSTYKTGTSAPVSVTIAHPKPTAAVTAPLANATVSGSSMLVTADAAPSTTPGATLSSVEFMLDGTTSLGYDYSAPYSVTWNMSQLIGNHTLTVVARESQYPYRSTTSAAVPVFVDNPLPGAAITSPTAGTLPRGPVTVTMTATPHAGSGSPVTKMELYVDGYRVGDATQTGTGTYQYVWDPLQDYGAHTLTAVATDAATRVGRSAPREVRVPEPAPVVTITSPSSGAVLKRGGYITFTATATPNPDTQSAVRFVEFTLVDDNPATGDEYLGYTYNATSPGVYSVEVYFDTSYTVGSRWVVATATDYDYEGTSAPVPVRVADLPGAPTSVKAVAGTNGTATITWAAPATNGGAPITKYRIATGTTGRDAPVTSPLSFVWTGLTNGSTYTFTVRAVTVAGVSTATPSNAVTPGIKTSLTQTVSASTISYGKTVTVTGTLKRTDTNALMGGRPVELLSCVHNTTSCSLITRANTGTSGTALGVVKFTYGPKSHRDIRLRFLTSGQYVKFTTAPKYVQVKAVVTGAFSKTSIPYGGTTTLTGYVKPAHGGQPLFIERYYSGAWHSLGYLTQTSGGTAAFGMQPPERGTFPFRLYFPGDADHLKAYSPTYSLRVY
jgi:hypothetical protein